MGRADERETSSPRKECLPRPREERFAEKGVLTEAQRGVVWGQDGL